MWKLTLLLLNWTICSFFLLEMQILDPLELATGMYKKEILDRLREQNVCTKFKLFL